MSKDSEKFTVYFTEEFSSSLDRIQAFFLEQGEEVLLWWFSMEDVIIKDIDELLSSFPYSGKKVGVGPFEGLRCITYGRSRHRMLNYIIFYEVDDVLKEINVINILPARSKRSRIR